MVNSIRGTLTFRKPDRLGVENGGIEWSIDTTATTLAAVGTVGSEIRIFTHLHHVQDQMKLYGFSTTEERELFLALISVNGVGPSLARKILSGTTPPRFREALDSEDLSALGKIPGLGKKTAQKIVLALRGTLAADEEVRGDSSDHHRARDVVEALAAMGFDSRSAARSVESILDDEDLSRLSGEDRDREVLRRAIIRLSS